jgi:hypothetical protein
MIPPKQAGVTILILDKVDFKPKLVRRHKEGHFILIKGAIYHEEIIIIYLYALKSVHPTLLNIH